MAKTLLGVQQLRLVVIMQVANGAVLHCDSHIPAATWTVQSCSFITNLKLLGLQYRIVYHLGTSNSAADALSRHPDPPTMCNVVTSLVPNWVQAAIASYSHDAVT